MRRAVVIVVAVLVVVVGVGGFFAIRFVSSHLDGQTVTPQAGDCWTTTFSDAQKTEDWEGAAAVSCGKQHQSYTYAVTKLATKFGYTSWLDSSHKIRTDVDQAAYAACQARQRAILPGISAKEALLYPTYYLPSVALWGSGARWVRCDITLIKSGSSVAKPQLDSLPAFASLRSTLATDPTRYALCEDDPASNGPDGADTTYADCKGPSDYTFIAQLTMAGAEGAAYPGLSALTATGEKQCAALPGMSAGHDVVAEPPLRLDWTTYDDRKLDCWRNNN